MVGEPGKPRLSTGWRLSLVVVAVAALTWGAAATFVSAELSSHALEEVVEQATDLDGQLRDLVLAGADLDDPDLRRVLVAGNGWLVAPDGSVLMGSPPLPELPTDISPDVAARENRLLSAIGSDGAVAIAPLFDDGNTSLLLVVGSSGPSILAQITRLQLLLAGLIGGLAVLIVAAGASLVRHMRLGLEQRNQALAALLRRERETVEKLGEVDRMKTAFLTAISHELRTPLTVVAGFTELLAARGADLPPEDIQRLAAGLQDKTIRLTGLIDDLLDVDRLARGVLEPKRGPVDVGVLLERTLGVLATPDHEIVVRDETETSIHVDPAHLQRVIENLVRNAAKHSPPGSPIDVIIEPNGTAVELVVADRGPGIPDEHKTAVFEPLQHVDDDSDPNPGLGVGLALVARLAQLHDGRAWISDRDGGGTEAHVRFEHALAPAA